MLRTLATSPVIAAAVFSLSGSGAGAQDPDRDDLAPFPAAAAGQTRHVIRLPAAEDENALRVGVIVGREMSVDCNRVRFSAPLDERTIQGWGYSYYVVADPGPAAATQMACPGQDTRRAFVRSVEEPLLRYNSRLPMVVYAPDELEVRYRIWTAGPEQTPGPR